MTQADDALPRSEAVTRIEDLLEVIDGERLPVPVREVWVYGDVALGLDPLERIDVYLTKDVLVRDDADREAQFRESHGIKGVGKSVRADWADAYPENLRANASGYAAPEKCLAAHLTDPDEPIHLEVCNASFEDNVTQRLRGAQLREDYTRLLDPRGVCLWVDGVRSEEALEKLREGAFALPTLPAALEMLGMDDEEATVAARELRAWRESQEGQTVRGDVV